MSDNEYEYDDDDDEYEYSDDNNCCDDDGSGDINDGVDANRNPPSGTGVVSKNPNASSMISGIRMLQSNEIVHDMKRRRKDVAEILGIPQSATCSLLREHKWSNEHCIEVFMEDSERLQKKCGVFHRCNPKPQPKSSENGDNCCPICYDDMEEGSKMAMPCGHEFCMDCWHDYCTNAIEQQGPSCVFLTCPETTCNEVVTEVEVETAAPNCLAKFRAFQIRHFVESNALTRWCPGAGCDRIACAPTLGALDHNGGVAHCEACTTSFCMVCGEEPHAPTTCKTLARWRDKCQDESETADWILANTKSCPKCMTRIEKNGGCNHMTCNKCRHEFCWICMQDWRGHRGCNRYKSTDSERTAAAKAKGEFDRYLHYYRRYRAQDQAHKFAKKQLKETAAKRVQESWSGTIWKDVEFLETANEQLVECRKVLKYTYVHAYYITNKIEKERFEYHQGLLENFTETLSHQSEKPLHEMDMFDVINKTRIVNQFIKNILKHIDDYDDEGMLDR